MIDFPEFPVKRGNREGCDAINEQQLVHRWYDDDFKSEEPQLFDNMDFPDVKSGYAYHSMNKNWNTHYKRAIENQLDYYHLPFVHEKTIGRGFKPASSGNLSNALEVTFENEVISASMKTGMGITSRYRFNIAEIA